MCEISHKILHQIVGGWTVMRCGAKRYIVEVKENGEKLIKDIVARTPAEARKKFRAKYGEQSEIISVREKNR